MFIKFTIFDFYSNLDIYLLILLEEFFKRKKGTHKKLKCSYKSPYCYQIKELPISNQPEVNVCSQDIVMSLRANYFMKPRLKAKKIHKKEKNHYDERNIIIKRRDHICDFREKVNATYDKYNTKAQEFFEDSNLKWYQGLNIKCQQYLAETLNHLNISDQKKSRKASQIRFSSFNQESISKDIKLVSSQQESDKVITVYSTNNKNNNVVAVKFTKCSEDEEDTDEYLLDKKSKTTQFTKKEDPEFLTLYSKFGPKNNNIRARSTPIVHSRDFLFEKKIMSKFFKRMYKESKVFCIIKSKTFNNEKPNLKANLSILEKKITGKNSLNDFELIGSNEDNNELMLTTSNPIKIVNDAKSIKSEKSDTCLDFPAKMKRFTLDDKEIEKKKQINYSKRFYKCKEFTKNCNAMFEEYTQMKREFEKKEIEKFKKNLEELKLLQKPKCVGEFDEPYEKKMNFVYQITRGIQIKLKKKNF